jgi:hypothetical protein
LLEQGTSQAIVRDDPLEGEEDAVEDGCQRHPRIRVGRQLRELLERLVAGRGVPESLFCTLALADIAKDAGEHPVPIGEELNEECLHQGFHPVPVACGLYTVPREAAPSAVDVLVECSLMALAQRLGHHDRQRLAYERSRRIAQ